MSVNSADVPPPPLDWLGTLNLPTSLCIHPPVSEHVSAIARHPMLITEPNSGYISIEPCQTLSFKNDTKILRNRGVGMKSLDQHRRKRLAELISVTTSNKKHARLTILL